MTKSAAPTFGSPPPRTLLGGGFVIPGKDQTDKHDTELISARLREIESRYIADVERNYGVTIVPHGKGEFDAQ